ncbi:MAG: hypothetical protein ACPGUY_08955, partial [Akkermansiaceae bacterium]
NTEQSITANVVFDEASLLGAFRLHMWHRYGIWLMLRTFLSIILIVAGVIMMMSRGGIDGPFPVLMIMVGTFALLRPLIWKIMHARNLRKLPGYGQAVTYTFTPKGVSIQGETSNGHAEWAGIFETYAHKQGLFIYHSKKIYTWIPAAALAGENDMQSITEWASSANK